MLSQQRRRLAAGAAALNALSPLKVLARGYSILYDGAGDPISGVSGVRENAPMRLVLSDGSVRFTPVGVEITRNGENRND